MTYKVEHDFTPQHVLQCPERVWVILRTKVLKRLEEIRVSCGIVLIFRMKDAGLEVELRLEVWRAIDRISGRSRRCEGCL